MLNKCLIYLDICKFEDAWNILKPDFGQSRLHRRDSICLVSLSITCGFLGSTEKFCQNAAKTQINEIKSQKSFKSLQIEPKYVQIVCNNCRHRFCTFAGRIPGRCLNVIFLPNSTEGIYFLLTPLQAYNWKSLGKAEDAHGSLKKQSATALQSKALQAQGYQAMDMIQVLQEVAEEVVQHCSCPLRYQRK